MVEPLTLMAAVTQLAPLGAGPATDQLKSTRAVPPLQLTLALEEPQAGTMMPLPAACVHWGGDAGVLAVSKVRRPDTPKAPSIINTAPAMMVVGRKISCRILLMVAQ